MFFYIPLFKLEGGECIRGARDVEVEQQEQGYKEEWVQYFYYCIYMERN